MSRVAANLPTLRERFYSQEDVDEILFFTLWTAEL